MRIVLSIKHKIMLDKRLQSSQNFRKTKSDANNCGMTKKISRKFSDNNRNFATENDFSIKTKTSQSQKRFTKDWEIIVTPKNLLLCVLYSKPNRETFSTQKTKKGTLCLTTAINKFMSLLSVLCVEGIFFRSFCFCLFL